MKNIVVGITSGIAAYKIGELVDLLRKDNQEVELILTQSAQKMLGEDTKKLFPKIKIHTDLFPDGFSYQNILQKREVEHIMVADSASLLVIAPATANVIAKLAYGIADDFLTTVVLATTAPILICPSMNVHMWEHPATQENLKILASRGVHILHPDSGALACGYTGVGRLPKIEKIKNEIIQIFNQCHPGLDPGSIRMDSPQGYFPLRGVARLRGNDKDRWLNKKILITAGGTNEPIDGVRIIGNRASGKMGAALAQVAYNQGAHVILLRAKSSISVHGVEEHIFESSADLEKLLARFVPTVDMVFHTAAVSDFSVEKPFYGKLDSGKKYSMELVPQKKLINEVKKINPNIFLVAFKAVYGKPQNGNSIKKLFDDSSADMIIANDISKNDRGFGTDTNEVVVFQKNKKPVTIKLASKIEVAEKILETMRIY